MNYGEFRHGRDGRQAQSRFGRAAAAQAHRVPCRHYPKCIGCPLIGVPYADQLERKHAALARIFRRYSSLAEIFLPVIIPSPRRLGYRGRVKLVVRGQKGKIATGLYVPGSHRVMDISRCPVHPRPVNDVLRFMKSTFQELGVRPYDERNDSGDLRHLDFRFSFARGELNVTLVTRRASFPEGIHLARLLRRRFRFVTGVVQNVNQQMGNVIWGDRYRTLSGCASIMEEMAGLEMIFPAGVFSQANPFTARKLYERVAAVAALRGGEAVLDLYCGVAPIALSIAARAGRVYGIDNNPLSISTAKRNARRNSIANCEFIAGDAAQSIAQLSRNVPRFDLVIANPPRKGIQAEAMKTLLAFGFPRIIYVSCAPESLARDLERLAHEGYRVTSVDLFDMFPQTEEIEAVILLESSRSEQRFVKFAQ